MLKDSKTGLESALDDAFVEYTSKSTASVRTFTLGTNVALDSMTDDIKVTFQGQGPGKRHLLEVGSQAYDVVRYSRMRTVEIEIFHGKKGTKVSDNTVIIWDNAGGMTTEELSGLMDLGNPREDAERPDKENICRTRGLECHIGQYGLGVHTAAFQMGEGEKRGFIVRTKDGGSSTVSEESLTSQMIDQGEKAIPKIPWTKCSTKGVGLAPGSSQGSLIPEELKEHSRVQQLLQQERDCEKAGMGFTWVIITGVRPSSSPVPPHAYSRNTVITATTVYLKLW